MIHKYLSLSIGAGLIAGLTAFTGNGASVDAALAYLNAGITGAILTVVWLLAKQYSNIDFFNKTFRSAKLAWIRLQRPGMDYRGLAPQV